MINRRHFGLVAQPPAINYHTGTDGPLNGMKFSTCRWLLKVAGATDKNHIY